MAQNNLINKILLTKSVKGSTILSEHHFSRCEELEKEGFGLLADKNDPAKFDESLSVIFPDGTVLPYSKINNYWDTKLGYSSKNPTDVLMHKARVYCLGLVESGEVPFL